MFLYARIYLCVGLLVCYCLVLIVAGYVVVCCVFVKYKLCTAHIIIEQHDVLFFFLHNYACAVYVLYTGCRDKAMHAKNVFACQN